VCEATLGELREEGVERSEVILVEPVSAVSAIHSHPRFALVPAGSSDKTDGQPSTMGL
jgi:hypothetical protein